jgi:hypothetical protein
MSILVLEASSTRLRPVPTKLKRDLRRVAVNILGRWFVKAHWRMEVEVPVDTDVSKGPKGWHQLDITSTVRSSGRYLRRVSFNSRVAGL